MRAWRQQDHTSVHAVHESQAGPQGARMPLPKHTTMNRLMV